MAHTVLITAHAAAGVLAFVAGLLALSRGRLFPVYRWSLAAMVAFLVGALAVRVAELDATRLAVFGALLALAGVMLWRCERAARMLPAQTDGPTSAYVHHIGFGLIGLFDAFWVVTLIRLDLPIGAVLGAAVGIAAAGHLLLERAGRRVDRRGLVAARVSAPARQRP